MPVAGRVRPATDNHRDDQRHDPLAPDQEAGDGRAGQLGEQHQELSAHHRVREGNTECGKPEDAEEPALCPAEWILGAYLGSGYFGSHHLGGGLLTVRHQPQRD